MLSHEWPIDAVHPNEDNPRRDVHDDPAYLGLVASIKSQGIIQPLLINKHGLILAGHRRYAAALELGLERVPVRIISDNKNHALIPLIENLQRADLTVMEVSDYLLKCRKECDMPISAIAEVTGISEGTIQKYLKLAEGPMEIRERVERDDITLGAAFALLDHNESFIRQVINEPVLTRKIVRELAKRSAIEAVKGTNEADAAVVKPQIEAYQERRRKDIAHVLETLEKVSLRLKPYNVEPTVTFGGAIHEVEKRLRDAADWLEKLENHLVGWSMLLRKQEERRTSARVETRGGSSLLN